MTRGAGAGGALAGAVRARLGLVGYGVWLALIAAVGLPLVLERHFHVDEIQIAYNIALWGVHHDPGASNYAQAFMVPLAWLVGRLDSSSSMLLALRMVFFALFLGGIVAMAELQPYFRGRGQRLVVLFAATLFFPLWHYGYEIRHDSLIALGAILMFGLTQTAVRREGVASWRLVALAGAATGAILMMGAKAFMFAIPYGGLFLAVALVRARAAAPRPGPGGMRRRLLTLAAFFGGLVVSIGLSMALLAQGGTLGLYLGLLGGRGGLGQPYTFSPTRPLFDLAAGSPLVFGGAAVFLAVLAVSAARSRGRVPLRSAVTAAYLVWPVAVLYINPLPFSYNFVHIAPFVFMAGLDLAARVRLADAGSARVVVAGVLVASALLFARDVQSDPYTSSSNRTQLSYMAGAEALTDPARDTVLDGAGLVLSRRPPGDDWMLHSLFMADYRAGRRESFAQMMIEHPSPVVITNYRWGWLSAHDLDVLHQRYIKLARDFYVLGRRVKSAAGQFAIYHAGRYLVRDGDGSQPVGISIDGAALDGTGLVELAVGTHRFSGADEDGLLEYWVGPHLESPPMLIPPRPGHRLFLNQTIRVER